MAEKTDDGISYLMALKRSAQDFAGSATVPASSSGSGAQNQAGAPTAAAHSSDEQYSGAEKRRSPRYKCEGSVEMRADGCDVRTWASFTDISLHGCYVEAQATYPAGTKLHMKLQAKSVKFETRGSVRVTYPYLGMGIAFEEMSDENRVLLRELLGTISRPAVIMGPGMASSAASSSPLDALPVISDADAALQALIQFFEARHMLTRDDFLQILAKSQDPGAKR